MGLAHYVCSYAVLIRELYIYEIYFVYIYVYIYICRSVSVYSLSEPVNWRLISILHEGLLQEELEVSV